MAKRMGRDVYGLGIAAGTLLPTAGPKMTPGQSKKAMYLQDQAKKAPKLSWPKNWLLKSMSVLLFR